MAGSIDKHPGFVTVKSFFFVFFLYYSKVPVSESGQDVSEWESGETGQGEWHVGSQYTMIMGQSEQKPCVKQNKKYLLWLLKPHEGLCAMCYVHMCYVLCVHWFYCDSMSYKPLPVESLGLVCFTQTSLSFHCEELLLCLLLCYLKVPISESGQDVREWESGWTGQGEWHVPHHVGGQ